MVVVVAAAVLMPLQSHFNVVPQTTRCFSAGGFISAYDRLITCVECVLEAVSAA